MNQKKALGLFIIPAFIWGSTWYAITFQLGKVDPIISVAYRSAIAGFILLIYSYLTKKNLKYSLKDHAFLFLQGTFLYGLNYWLVYVAESTIPSGLVAVVFSLIVVMNVIFGAIFLHIPVKRKLIWGALLGLIGTFFIFFPEIKGINFSKEYIQALIISFGGVVLASLGNIIASNNYKREIPVIQSNAFGMIYGGAILSVIALVLGKEFRFDFSISYISSLLYLAVFGSIIAFNSYLKLMSVWGPGKTAYTTLLTPIIAIFISWLLEGYHFTIYAFIGAALVLAGNYIVVVKPKPKES